MLGSSSTAMWRLSPTRPLSATKTDAPTASVPTPTPASALTRTRLLTALLLLAFMAAVAVDVASTRAAVVAFLAPPLPLAAAAAAALVLVVVPRAGLPLGRVCPVPDEAAYIGVEGRARRRTGVGAELLGTPALDTPPLVPPADADDDEDPAAVAAVLVLDVVMPVADPRCFAMRVCVVVVKPDELIELPESRRFDAIEGALVAHVGSEDCRL